MESRIQVVEFKLGDERYCLSIEDIDEIVDMDGSELTELPNSARHVEGLLNLRGKTATIHNPKKRFDMGDTSLGNRVIFFNTGDGPTADEAVGWAVDDVDRVMEIQPESAMEPDYSQDLKGILNREDEFLFWVDPNLAV